MESFQNTNNNNRRTNGRINSKPNRTTLPLSGLGMKIFLDRYSLKANNKLGWPEGTQILVRVKDEFGYESTEIGTLCSSFYSPLTFKPSVAHVKLQGSDTSFEVSFDNIDIPIETPNQTYLRVAKAVAGVSDSHDTHDLVSEETANKFYEQMASHKFVPGGRILAGMGNDSAVLCSSNCIVLPCPEDSREGIFKSVQDMAECMARGSGVGINYSSLRPKGAVVRGVNGTSSGAVSWIELHSFTTGCIIQGGCFTAETQVLTSKGSFPIKELIERYESGEKFNCWTAHGWHPMVDSFRNGKKEIVKFTTKSGKSIRLTPDHKMMTVNKLGEYRLCAAIDITPDLKVLLALGNMIIPTEDSWSLDIKRNTVPDEVLLVEPAGAEETYDITVDVVHTLSANGFYVSNSRRGAHMAMLADWHPDIEEFISHKKEAGRTTNANISVIMSDALMKAVEEDAAWDLEFPLTDHPQYKEKWKGDLGEWKELGLPTRVYKTMRARDLFRQIAESAWASAEPGVWFGDQANRTTPLNNGEKLICTNPCLTGDSRVFTKEGMLKIEDMFNSGKAYELLMDSRRSENQFMQSSPVFQTGVKPVFRLETKEGYSVKLTADHRVMTERGWAEAGNLQEGDKVHISDRGGCFGKEGSRELGLVLGWLIGDGSLKADGGAELSFFGDKRDYAEDFAKAVESIIPKTNAGSAKNPIQVIEIKGRNESRIVSKRLGALCAELNVNKNHVPEVVFIGTKEMQLAFIQALFSADGHVEMRKKNQSAAVVLSSISLSLLQDVQKILVNLGCYGRIYQNRKKSGMKLLPDGSGGKKLYNCQATHDIRISSVDFDVFREHIKFLSGYQQTKLDSVLGESYKKSSRYFARFTKLVPDGVEMVYDVTVPGPEAFVSDCVSVHNCAEQSLPANGVCNLGHINLAKFVKKNAWEPRTGSELFTSKVDLAFQNFDWKSFEESVEFGILFLDSVIDKSHYPLPQIKEQQQKDRRIGLGTLGLGELLVRLGLRYGSSEAVQFTRFVYQTFYHIANQISKQLGDEIRVTVPDYAYTQECVRHNVTLTTQAPTGTVGTMLGTSTGIEPFFALEWTRKGRLGTNQEQCGVFKEYKEYMSKLATPPEEGSKLPDYFVTAHELTVDEHLAMLEVIQKYGTDSSISKTVNMPSSATVEDVEKLYMKAYSLGLKGVAMYRDGSRDTQVLYVNDSEANEEVKEDINEDNNKETAKEKLEDTYEYVEDVDGYEYEDDVDDDGESDEELLEAYRDYKNSKLPFADFQKLQEVKEVQEEDSYPQTRESLAHNNSENKAKSVRVSRRTAGGTVHTHLDRNSHGNFTDVFVNIGTSGSDVMAFAEALGRLISLQLQSEHYDTGKTLDSIIGQLEGIGGTASGFGPNSSCSIPDAIAKCLKEAKQLHQNTELEKPAHSKAILTKANDKALNKALGKVIDKQEKISYTPTVKLQAKSENTATSTNNKSSDLCPSCGSLSLRRESGCKNCPCGYSACG